MSKSDHGSAPQLKVDGAYVEFQLAVLRALPRDINPDIADQWRNDGQGLAKVLRGALLSPGKLATEIAQPKPAPLPKSIIVDCDLDPYVPSGLYLTGEGTEHRKMGRVTLEKRDDGKLYANGVEVVRYLSMKQQNGKVIQGHKLREELMDNKVQVFNACIMDALLANPQLIPDEWKTGYTYFWGTIFRRADGSLYVECLCWFDGRWFWRCYWLGSGWFDQGPAASLAA